LQVVVEGVGEQFLFVLGQQSGEISGGSTTIVRLPATS
jgi:hypothetical protein